jgi:hypothetical protein
LTEGQAKQLYRKIIMGRPSDVFLLYAARAAGAFGDEFAIIILPAYLSELGFARQ